MVATAFAITKEGIDAEQASIQAAELTETQKTEYEGRLGKAAASLVAKAQPVPSLPIQQANRSISPS